MDRRKLPILTNSSIKTFRRCPRLYWFTYVALRRPIVESEYIRFGTLWHTAMEAWWGWLAHYPTANVERLYAYALEALDNAPTISKGNFDASRICLEELLAGYAARWPDDPAIYSVQAVEKPFSVYRMMLGRFRLSGQMDAVVKTKSGMAIIEHKTTGSDIAPGSWYWQRIITMDSQVSAYLAAGPKAMQGRVFLWQGNPRNRRRVETPWSCIYDVVRRPALKPYLKTPPDKVKLTQNGRPYANVRLQDETEEEFRDRVREEIKADPDKYFQRQEIVRLQADEAKFIYDIKGWSQAIRNSEKLGSWPKNPDSCQEYGGCPYLRVCSGEASIDDNAIFRTARTPHEELKGEKKNGTFTVASIDKALGSNSTVVLDDPSAVCTFEEMK